MRVLRRLDGCANWWRNLEHDPRAVVHIGADELAVTAKVAPPLMTAVAFTERSCSCPKFGPGR